MEIAPIKAQGDYRRILKEIEGLGLRTTYTARYPPGTSSFGKASGR